MTAAAIERDGAQFRPGRLWAVVIVLTLVGTINMMDRFLPAVLAEPIKHDLLLSDTAIGLINGFGFLVIYAVLGIPIARLSDRGRYGVVISVCVALWSTMTILGGLAQSGWQLALTRMGVAVGEAGSTPAAHAFISRNFPPNRRAAPLAVLTMSVPIAGTIGLMGGGLLGEMLGWRTAFIVMGIVSLVFAPIVFFALRDGKPLPPAPPKATGSRNDALALMQKPSFMLIVGGCALIAVAGYSLTTFTPAFLARHHGLSVAEVGVEYGLASGAAGIVGLFIAGQLADRLSTRDPRWLLWIVVVMIAVLAPFSAVGLLAPTSGTAIGFISLANVISSAFMGPAVAALQRVAPVRARATASALMLFVSAMLGGLGPLATGMISDALQPQYGKAALGYGLLVVVPAAHAVSAILFLLASLMFLRDIGREDAPEDASDLIPQAAAEQ